MHKRSPVFRDVLFATAELFDPFDPVDRFNRCGRLLEIEEEWCFRRDAVPEWITLRTGRAARKYFLQRLEEEYELDPATRFKRLKDSTQAFLYDPLDPDTWWDDPFLCLITVAPKHSGLEAEFNWFGGRA